MLTGFNHEILILIHRERKNVRDIGLVMKNGDKSFKDRSRNLIRDGFLDRIAVYGKLFSPKITGVNKYLTQRGTIGCDINRYDTERVNRDLPVLEFYICFFPGKWIRLSKRKPYRVVPSFNPWITAGVLWDV